MKNMPLLFAGIFFTLAFSWMGVVFVNHIQLSDLKPMTANFAQGEDGQMLMGVPQDGEPLNPQPLVGSAQRGKIVYQKQGCMYCHSQQVRRKGFGSDYARGWGDRQSVARDYIEFDRVMLGTMRTGPDLANVGGRYPDLWHHQHMYNPQITSPGSIMPPFRFLYDVRPIGPQGPSPLAIELPDNQGIPDGYEVVPTQDALDLVAYMQNLNITAYELPEMKYSE